MKKFSLKIMAAVLAASVSVSSVGAMKRTSTTTTKESDKVKSSMEDEKLTAIDSSKQVELVCKAFDLMKEAMNSIDKARIIVVVASRKALMTSNDKEKYNELIDEIKSKDLEYFERACDFCDKYPNEFSIAYTPLCSMIMHKAGLRCKV